MEYLQRKILNTWLKRVEFCYIANLIHCNIVVLKKPPKNSFLGDFLITSLLLLLLYRRLAIPL